MSLRLVWLAERHLDYKVEFIGSEMLFLKQSASRWFI